MGALQDRLIGFGTLVFAVVLLAAGGAQALPALQLGPGGGNWSYDASTQTWITPDNPLQLAAYANATQLEGGNGDYAWATTGEARVAYLVVSAMPKQTDPPGGDLFDITLSNDGVDITVTNLIASGYGTPPVSDPNDLAPHSIFSTYYEVYAFEFNGVPEPIGDTQPGGTGSGMGYLEYLDIAVGPLAAGVEGLHYDLYTLNSLNPGQVQSFAPFSHDAQYLVPEPSAALLFGVGGLIAGTTLRRRRC